MSLYLPLVSIALFLQGSENPSVVDVVNSVKSNENLFSSVQFIMENNFVLDKHSYGNKHDFAARTLFTLFEYTSIGSNIRVIYDENGQGRTSKDVFNHHYLLVSDGKKSFRLTNGKIVNDDEGPPSDSDCLYPHSLIGWRLLQMRFPLSDFIGGEETMIRHDSMKEFHFTSRVVGFDRFEGESCVKIEVEARPKDTNQSSKWERSILWLAVNKNYFPIHFESRAARIDGNLTCDGKIDQFQEIERGIWFPVVMTTRGYDEGGYMFRKDNPIQIGHTTTIKISRVTLNPKVPEGFFTPPANPIGATVILLKNGKPIKSFVEGKAIPRPKAYRHFPWKRTFLAIAVAATFILLIYSIVRYRLAARFSS